MAQQFQNFIFYKLLKIFEKLANQFGRGEDQLFLNFMFININIMNLCKIYILLTLLYLHTFQQKKINYYLTKKK